MVKVTTKKTTEPQTASWPLDSSSLYNMKIDRESQQFYIDDEELEYDQFDEFTFRVINTYSKLVVYNDDFEVTNESTLFQWGNEAKDARDSQTYTDDRKLGSCCGRIFDKKITAAMSDEEKEKNKSKAKWYTFLFGIVYIPGQNPLLCDMRIAGGKQKEVGDLLNKIKEQKKDYHRAELKFKAFNNAEFDWPEIEVQADFSRDLPVTGLEPFMDTIKAYVANHNNKITDKAEKYKKFGSNKKPFKKTFKKPTTDKEIPF